MSIARADLRAVVSRAEDKKPFEQRRQIAKPKRGRTGLSFKRNTP